MSTRGTRIEPSPYQEFVIDSILENSDGQKALLDTIQYLSEERNALRLRHAEHLHADHAAALRIQIINSQLKALWAEVQHQRGRRVANVRSAS